MLSEFLEALPEQGLKEVVEVGVFALEHLNIFCCQLEW